MDKGERYFAQFTFLVEETPLAKAFIRKCCNVKNDFEGCLVKFLKGVRMLSFGEKRHKEPKHLEDIGELSRYKKPFFRGAVGVLAKIENETFIDVNNLTVYINMLVEPPKDEYFSCIDEENGEKFMNLCFGEVYENIDSLGCLDPTSNDRVVISKCGVTVDAEEESDPED